MADSRVPTCAKPSWCESLSQHQSGAVLPCCSTRVEVYSHVYAILSWLSTSFRRMSIACRYAPLQATSGDEGTQDHLPHQGRESFSDSITDDREDFSSDSAPLIGGRPCSPINSVGNSFLEGCQFFTTSLSTAMLDSPVLQASYRTRSPLHMVLCNGTTSDSDCLG